MRLKFVTIFATIFSTYSIVCATINDDDDDGYSGVVSFKNVRVLGKNGSTLVFNITIDSSNKLTIRENVQFIDKIELLNDIPVLYEDAITDMDNNLKELTMESNNLHEIQPGAFKNLQTPINVYITENELKVIKTGVFNNLPIKILDLSFNRIEQIDAGAFRNMPELREINLNHNNLKQWHQNWFENTPKLFWIFARSNQIEQLPAEAFGWLKNSTDVGIWLDNNKIQKIHENTFKHLVDVSTLGLSENQIETFNGNWLDGIKILLSLDISKNKLTCLHNGDFDKIFKAKTTDIDRNPWDCECLKHIKTYSDNHKDNKIIDMAEAVQTCKL